MSFNELYDISYHKIGESAVGMVYYGTEIRTNTPVAIKLICKASTKLDPYFMEREANTLLSITHENINRVRGIYESAENLYIVMDLCVGNDVFTHAIRKVLFRGRCPGDHQANLSSSSLPTLASHSAPGD